MKKGSKKRAPAKPKTRTKKTTKKKPRRASTSAPAAADTASPPPPPDPNAWRLIDRDQLAEMLGVHPDTLSDFTREGMPVVDRGGRGMKSTYDLVSCAAWWRQHKTELAAKDVAQARAFKATAEINELKAAEKKGELVPREEVIREGQNYTKAWAAKVRGLPRQLQLAGVITRDQEPAIAAQCRELLTDISSWQSVDDSIQAAALEPTP